MRLEGLLAKAARQLLQCHGLALASAALMARNHKQAAAIEREALEAADAIDDVLTERNVTHLAALMATVTVAARTAARAAYGARRFGGPTGFLRRRLQEEA